ncbi:MAG: AAA family ATPase [archaeon]
MIAILIAGAPGTGKSTVAQMLADRLGIHRVIGTDTIREIMRCCISSKKCPVLHTSAILASAPE